MKVSFLNQLGSLLIIAFFIFIAFGSDESLKGAGGMSNEFENAENYENAAMLAEKYLVEYQSEYDVLCTEARNRQLREKFLSLEKKVAELSGFADKCEKLDYDKQRMLRNYIENSIKSKSNLNNLIEGRIECWE
jgi:hypothetical protein